MALSYKDYIADGQTKDFPIPFPYFHADDVKVYVNGKTANRKINNKVVSLDSPPQADSTIRVKRETPLHERAVDFYDGAILSEDILDTANEQLFYVAQEVRDYTEGILKMLEDGHFTALNRRIRDVADPEEVKDAVNLGFIQTKYLPQAKAEADRAANERIQAGNIYNSTVAVKNETQAFHDQAYAYRNQAVHYSEKSLAHSNTSLSYKDQAGQEVVKAQNEVTRAKEEANRAKGEADRARNYVDKYKPGVKGSWIFSDYRNWAVDDVGAGGACIYNDNGTYKALMIVGNAAKGDKKRRITLYDDVITNGELHTKGGIYIAGHEAYHRGNITISASAPSGGLHHNIWFKYS